VDTPDAQELSLLGTRLPPHLRLRTVVLPAGDSVAFQRADWVDALVVVELGELEVERGDGTHVTFRTGAILVLDLPDPRWLRNRGAGPLVLSVVSRRRRPG
jgi:quercetin dioxygenase-like cupin family protein